MRPAREDFHVVALSNRKSLQLLLTTLQIKAARSVGSARPKL
jgi:hypothetical protein